MIGYFLCQFLSRDKIWEIFFYKIPFLVCTQLFSKNLAAPVQGLSVSFPPAKLHCILQDFKVVSIPLSKSMMISDARPLLCTDADSSNAAGISGSGGMTFSQVFLSNYNVKIQDSVISQLFYFSQLFPVPVAAKAKSLLTNILPLFCNAQLQTRL